MSNFTTILSGSNAFYNQENYADTLSNWVSNTKYTISLGATKTEKKIITFIKKIFEIIFFLPLFIYRSLQTLARVLVIPTTTFFFNKIQKEAIEYLKTSLKKEDLLKYHRFTVEVDGIKVDAAIVGTVETLAKKRWVLKSNGNAELYEWNLMPDSDFRHILTELNSNALLFNYPKKKDCKEALTPETLGKVYRAMLTFLEEKAEAKEIIGYSFSIGGAVQAKALETHEFKSQVKYVWIKDRTFSNLIKTVNTLIFPPLGYLVKLLGWNIDTASSSKTLRTPEIILQRASSNKTIINDGVISAEASLAKALVKDNTHLKKRKKIIGLKENHNQSIKNPRFIPFNPPFNKKNGQVDALFNYSSSTQCHVNLVPQIAFMVEEAFRNYPKDSHLNMRQLKPYIKKATKKEETLNQILEENEVQVEVSFFGTRQIRLQGAGTASLKWITQVNQSNNEALKSKLAEYEKHTNELLKKKSYITRFFARIQNRKP